MGGFLVLLELLVMFEDLRLTLHRAKLPDTRASPHSSLRNAHKELCNQLSLRAEGKVAARMKPLGELVPVWQFQALLMYLPTLQGKAAASTSSNAQSPQSAAAGGQAPDPKKLTKAERNRKQLV